jgi:hypothetical protein
MGTYVGPFHDTLDGTRGFGFRSKWSVLTVFEAGRGGEAAMREAAVGAALWVATLAPQVRPYKCCGGGGAGPYNCAVRGVAEDELRQARGLLGSSVPYARFTTLRGTPQPPLAAFANEHAFDIIVLPAHRPTSSRRRLVRALRQETAAEIRPVG